MNRIKIIIFTAFLFVFLTDAAFSASLEIISSAVYESEYEDSTWDIAVDSQGNVIITGSRHYDAGAFFFTVKYDLDLAEVLGSTQSNRPEGENYDEARSVAVDGQDNIVVAGVSAVGTGDDFPYDTDTYYVVKYTPEFEITSSTVGPLPDDVSVGMILSKPAVAVDGDGNNIVAVSILIEGGFYYNIIRYNPSLTEIINSTVNVREGHMDFAYDLAIDSQGNIIVTGYSYDEQTEDNSYYTVKYNPDLTEVLAEHTYDITSMMDMGYAVTIDSNDNIIVTGMSGYEYVESSSRGSTSNLLFPQESYSGNYFTVKYSPDLEVLRTASYNSGGGDIARSVAVDSSDNVVVTGQAGYGSDNGNYYTIVYDSNLNEIASAAYNSGSDDGATGVAVRGNNIVVTGTIYDGGQQKYCTLKYRLQPKTAVSSPDDEGEVKVVVPEGAGKRGTINPDSGQPVIVNFKGSRSGSYTLRIFTQLGEQVHSERITAGSAEGWFEWIPKGLASGVYFVHVKGPGIDIYEKVALLR